mgnify:CR=1 FL=1
MLPGAHFDLNMLVILAQLLRTRRSEPFTVEHQA